MQMGEKKGVIPFYKEAFARLHGIERTQGKEELFYSTHASETVNGNSKYVRSAAPLNTGSPAQNRFNSKGRPMLRVSCGFPRCEVRHTKRDARTHRWRGVNVLMATSSV